METNPNLIQNSKYDALLSEVSDYVTVKPVDTPRTIYLVGKAKGNRGYREFATEIGTSPAFLYYVLNGKSLKIRPNTIAGLVNAAAAQSDVTLEGLMDAQGCIRKKDFDSFDANYHSDIRRILIDELLKSGYKVAYAEKYDPERDPTDAPVMLWLRHPGTDEFITCDFRIKTCPIVKTTDNVDEMISLWLNETVRGNFSRKDRLFLVIDNPDVYQKMRIKVEQLRNSNDITLLLVDPQKRMVISENTVSESDGGQSTLMFSPNEIEVDLTNCYPFREIQIKRARALIVEKLLAKRYLIWQIDPENFQPPDQIAHTQPDFTLAVKSPGRKPFYWAFTLLLLPRDADETASREKIRAWITKSIVYFYMGGRLDRLSLVVHNKVIYNYVLEEISSLHMNNEISVICVSFLQGKIIYEYRIPIEEKLLLE